MPNISFIAVTGNLGNDAELKYLESGTPLVKFSLAFNESKWDSNTQQREKQSTWYKVTWFGKLGESMALALTKGSKVTVSGTLSYYRYSIAGVDKEIKEINASMVDLHNHQKSEAKPEPKPEQHPYDDDLPF